MKESVFASESEFEAAVAQVCDNALKLARLDGVIVRQCGLDVAVFTSKFGLKLVETKVYSGQRLGSIGFGTQAGGGPQVRLLSGNPAALEALDRSVVWAFADTTMPLGSPRFAVVTSSSAADFARGEVKAGKQNNFNRMRLEPHLVSWPEFCSALAAFLEETYEK